MTQEYMLHVPEAVGSYTTFHFLKATMKWYMYLPLSSPNSFVWWFLVASQVITASVSLDQTENPGVYFTNLVAQLQLAILNYNEVQINIVTGPLLDIDYFQIVPHWKWQIWVVCIIPIFNQLDQILLQSRNELKLVGSHMEQANEMVMEW